MVNLNPAAKSAYEAGVYYVEIPKDDPYVDCCVPIYPEDSIEFPEQQSNSVPPFLRIDYSAMKIIIPEKSPHVKGEAIPETEPEKCLAQREEFKNAQWIKDLDTDSENVRLAKKIARCCGHKEHDTYIDPREHYRLSRICLNEIRTLQSEGDWFYIRELGKEGVDEVGKRILHVCGVTFFQREYNQIELNEASGKPLVEGLNCMGKEEKEFVSSVGKAIKKAATNPGPQLIPVKNKKSWCDYALNVLALSIFAACVRRFPKLCVCLVSPYVVYKTITLLHKKFRPKTEPKDIQNEPFKFLYIHRPNNDHKSGNTTISDVRA